MNSIIKGFFYGLFYYQDKAGLQRTDAFIPNLEAINNLYRKGLFDEYEIRQIYGTSWKGDLGYSADSLARSLPLLFANYTQVIQDVDQTNPHPENRDAGLLYNYALKQLVERPKEGVQIFNEIRGLAQTQKIRDILETIARGETIDVSEDNIFSHFFLVMNVLSHVENPFNGKWTSAMDYLYEHSPNPEITMPLGSALVSPQTGSGEAESLYPRALALLGLGYELKLGRIYADIQKAQLPGVQTQPTGGFLQNIPVVGRFF